MKLTSGALPLVFAAACSGHTLERKAGNAGKAEGDRLRVVGFDLQRSNVADPVLHDRKRLRKRETLDLTVDNEQTLYLLNATIGTPPQPVRLHVDTGSSDMWVNTPDSRFCSSRQDPCAPTGTYAANSSSSYTYLNSLFNISYADGSGATGDYVSDTLRLPGASINNFQFGVGYVSSSDQNILGIGYAANEVQAAAHGMKPYNNLPLAMLSQGIIAANVYSLWLDDFDSNTGRLLFGGVDTSRFRGDLVTLPVQRTAKSSPYSAFFITMTGLSMDSQAISSDMALAVLLDSGTSLTYLPNQIVADIYDQANVTYQETQGIGTIPCSANASDSTLVFNFSSPASVSVPMSELVLTLGNTTSTDGDGGLGGSDGSSGSVCLFGIAPSDGSTVVLGDTFLRSAYVVYDLDNNEVSIAQSDVNATGAGDVVEIRKGTALPSSTRAADPVPARSGLPSQRGARSGGSTSSIQVSVSLVSVMAVAVMIFL